MKHSDIQFFFRFFIVVERRKMKQNSIELSVLWELQKLAERENIDENFTCSNFSGSCAFLVNIFNFEVFKQRKLNLASVCVLYDMFVTIFNFRQS